MINQYQIGMKNILFPTDFSAAAEKAFAYAMFLADQWKARITTLHVYSPVDEGVAKHLPVTMKHISDSIELEEFEDYRNSVPHLRERAELMGYSHLEFNHVMKEAGKIIPAILSQAEEEETDLIVMGTTGARGLKEIFLGSVTGEILESAHCPVLAIPEEAVFDNHIDRIAFTTNYQEDEVPALDEVLRFAAPMNAEVHVVHVDLGGEESGRRMERLQAASRKYPKLYFEVIRNDNLFEGLTSFLDDKEIDILAMVTHKRRFLKELFDYSRTKRMSYHSHTPILSFPAGEK